MKIAIAGVSLAALLLATPALAQVSQTVVVVGATPIVGTCTNNFNLYNNNGVVGCQANGGGGGSGTVTSVSASDGLLSVATPTTTPALSVAGTSGGVPYFNSATSWASSAALAANSLMVGGGAGVAPSTVTTNATALTALGATPTGSGSVVLATSPALVTPALGVATGTSLVLGGATLGSNALAVTGLANFASVGSASAPSLSVGNQTSGLYSVSTTGFGVTVNGVSKMDYGITSGGAWNVLGAFTGNSTGAFAASITSTGTNTLISGPSFRSSGTKPTSVFAGGTCAGGTLTGGVTAGTATLTGVCAATNTWTLSVMPTQTTGYTCEANDRTTPAAVLQETSTSTTTAVFTFSGTTGSTDVLQYWCIGY